MELECGQAILWNILESYGLKPVPDKGMERVLESRKIIYYNINNNNNNDDNNNNNNNNNNKC